MAASRGLLSASALFAMLSLIGVALQFALAPPTTGPGVSGVLEMYASPAFRLQGWIVLAQVFFMFLALWGIAAARFRASPGAVWLAIGLLVLWQVLELVPRSIDVVAAAGSWGPAWAAESDPERKAELAAMLLGWDRVWSSLGLVRRLVWGGAHLAFGIAFIQGAWVERVVAGLFLFNALRLLPRTLAGVIGWDAGRGILADPIWFVLGMVGLFVGLLGWLWREAGSRGDR